MSYAIGKRIKKIRTSKNVTQEEIASLLDTTRQRYSRLEKGQSDISYIEIKKIADYFGISTTDITEAAEESKEIVAYFREKNSCQDVINSVEKVEEILKVFNAHQKLYYQKKGDDRYVD